jgi:hypothetical protein
VAAVHVSDTMQLSAQLSRGLERGYFLAFGNAINSPTIPRRKVSTHTAMMTPPQRIAISPETKPSAHNAAAVPHPEVNIAHFLKALGCIGQAAGFENAFTAIADHA